LFGAEADGTLPSGARFKALPAPRGTWTKVTLSLRDVLATLGAPMKLQRFAVFRHRDVDVPILPLEVGLYVALPRNETGRFAFGRIEHALRAPPQVVLDHGKGGETELDGWHAAWNLDHRNYEKAARILSSVVDRAPTKQNYVLLGDALLLKGAPAPARDAYRRAVDLGGGREAFKGLGYANAAIGDLDEAVRWFTRAKDEYAATDTEVPRRGYLDALKGLARALAKKGDCEGARKYADEAHRESADVRLELPFQKCPELEKL
jgi:tetratricopeptide (TPR) repeat protein